MRSRRIGAAVGLGLVLTALPAPAPTWAAELVATPERGGRVAAAKGCGTCHALAGEARGKKPGPPFLSPASPEAASEVLRRLWNHIPGMRQHYVARGLAWPAFSVQEMTDLLSFLGADSDRERAANLDRGRLLRNDRGLVVISSCGRNSLTVLSWGLPSYHQNFSGGAPSRAGNSKRMREVLG